MASKASKTQSADATAGKAAAAKTPGSMTPAAQTPDAQRVAPTKPAVAKAAPGKAAAKKTGAKKAAPRKSVSKPSAPKTARKSKAATLQSDLKALETRLKRADTVTRNSVSALQTIVSALEARVKTTTTAQKAQLTRQVNSLSARLDDNVTKTRAHVRADIKAALSAGGLERLEAAIARSSERLDIAELAQADSITRINRHLADMARAVDARIAQEARDRARDIAGLEDRLRAARGEAEGQIIARIDTIERDSADALTRVGDQVTEIHSRLEDRRRTDADVVAEKVNELALQTQAELEIHQSRLDARLSELEVAHSKIDTEALSGAAEDAAARLRGQLEAQIGRLQNRIDELERETAQVAILAHAAQNNAAQNNAVQNGSANNNVARNSAGHGQAPQLLQRIQPGRSGTPTPAYGAPGGSASNPYAAALDPSAPIDPQALIQPVDAAPRFEDTVKDDAPATPRPAHMPEEFDPSAYQAASSNSVVAFAPVQALRQPAPAAPDLRAPSSYQTVPPVPAPHAPIPAPNPAPTTAPAEPEAPPMPLGTSRAPATQPLAAPHPTVSRRMPDFPPAPHPAPETGGQPGAAPDFAPAPLPAAPYANPAYAEDVPADGPVFTGDSPKAVRITGGDPKRSRTKGLASRLPLSSRNLKLGALMVGVSAVAVITAKSLLGGNPAPNPEARLQPMLDVPPSRQPVQPTQAAQGTAQPVAVAPLSAETSEPIGQYREAAPVRIDASKLTSLDKAVRAGDPIAQFQMGLAKIEQGDAAQAAELLQKAADQDQPAALYRLAKLYEAGEGVDANDETARRLIERAARGGNRIAMHDLALYHTEGRGGLPVNILTARSWFEQAAMRGVIDSQYNLAVLSESAEGGLVPNAEDAFFWYSVAAQQGDQFAIQRRDQLAPTVPPEMAERIKARMAGFTPRGIDEEANGIFGPQPWTQAAPKAASGPDDAVRSAQTLLAQLGYEVGAPDGLMGAKTRAAVMSFESTNGLPPTGRINDDLIDRLKLATGT